MQKLKSKLTRYPFGLTAAILALITAAPLLIMSDPALAYAQVTNRSIQMTTAHISASDNMTVVFTNQTAANGSLVINFCKESPISGATCTTPTGFSAASATLTNVSLPAGWTVGTNAAGTFQAKGGTTLAATTSYSFTMTGVTNPNGTDCATVNCTFYARLYLYNGTTFGTYSSSTSPGNFLDFGGFALSTANDIVINATVQETLTFCTSKAAPGNGCTGLTTPTLTIGNGGTPNVLDAAGVYTDTAFTQITSNAASGVVVDLFQLGGWSCAGLSKDGGTTCGIPGKTSFSAITAGTAAFGLNVADGTGGTGSVSHNASFGTTAGSYNYPASVTTAPGPAIESSSAATTNVNSQLTFGATASATTAAGVYTTTDSLIATGTF